MWSEPGAEHPSIKAKWSWLSLLAPVESDHTYCVANQLEAYPLAAALKHWATKPVGAPSLWVHLLLWPCPSSLHIWGPKCPVPEGCQPGTALSLMAAVVLGTCLEDTWERGNTSHSRPHGSLQAHSCASGQAGPRACGGDSPGTQPDWVASWPTPIPQPAAEPPCPLSVRCKPPSGPAGCAGESWGQCLCAACSVGG